MFRDGKKLDYLFLSLAILVLDQWTKWLGEVHLPHSASHPVLPGFFNLTHVKNTGVAFGLFASQGADGGAWLLIVMGIVALAAVFLYFRLAPAKNRLLLYSLALIVGGAVGNLIDRLASGAVTDFLDVYVGTYHWPAFNVADSAITVGIGLMILDSFRSHRTGEAAGERDEPPADSERAAASEV
ncbi:MAG TPA: signal peptidase II [Thermoanaerobaculia bacterium]|nr:signal peptidase II [Thermoanaerobaculia bacterium]